jgi:hypothetical protein
VSRSWTANALESVSRIRLKRILNQARTRRKILWGGRHGE